MYYIFYAVSKDIQLDYTFDHKGCSPVWPNCLIWPNRAKMAISAVSFMVKKYSQVVCLWKLHKKCRTTVNILY